MSIALVAAGVAALLLGWAVMVFNRLVRRRNQVRTAWADVDVQLMRRHDLVPALARAVSAYADHERGTLLQLAAERDVTVARFEQRARFGRVDQSARVDAALE